MRYFNAQDIRAALPMDGLIDDLEAAFLGKSHVPSRQVIEVPGGDGRLLLAMPAHDPGGSGIIKLATVFPDNSAKNLPTIHAAIVAFDENGIPTAVLDGTIITQLRTGAASGLASKYLSRPDSRHLLIIGTGALVPAMAMAHATARQIDRISIYGRKPERAAEAAAMVRSWLGDEARVEATVSIESAAATADIITCATSSKDPVLKGEWLRPGTHVDLVGSFSPECREVDDAVVLGASIFVDTMSGALEEAGDILDPIARGVIDRTAIRGELADLVSGRVQGRTNDTEITLFKSVGSALEDLAAARRVLYSASGAGGAVDLQAQMS